MLLFFFLFLIVIYVNRELVKNKKTSRSFYNIKTVFCMVLTCNRVENLVSSVYILKNRNGSFDIGIVIGGQVNAKR